ncbi:uncharacterized protein DUF547 [Maribacter vaceletii]|uniref:Uncharacterized protein DUF547 n=1 Tax=Maribacter vaceletii TaxID=1206816 RepID=A0A495EET9_9FLAO|nr:DUF547 domain-containing protein [Maribacter vaceletii]RKR15179.1 uncharacterized protein DUF547 [Maribacter vaceletii]
MKKVVILAVLCLISYKSNAQSTDVFFTKADNFFSKHVKNGRVAYSEIKKDTKELNEILNIANGLKLDKENAKEYQAFWINAYNLNVINSVVENYPIKSPLDKAGFFDKKKHNVGGKNITLNDIENKLLRGNFPMEPRFHFVLVCAGLGCPPIINKAYKPSTLEKQLQMQTNKALNDPSFIQVNKNKVKISQIFEWYKGDFTKNGSLVDYINQYKKEKLPMKAKVSYYPYDWTLNDLK